MGQGFAPTTAHPGTSGKTGQGRVTRGKGARRGFCRSRRRRAHDNGVVSLTGILRWAVPLFCTVSFYGLAGGLWKTSSLEFGQFCVLFFLTKTVTNWGAWLAQGRPRPFDAGRAAFLRWAVLGQLVNGIAWICYFKALSTGPAAIVQTITAAYTALTVILALIFLKERLVAIQLLGVAMVVGSSVALGLTSGPQEGGAMGLWFYASLGTLLSWGVCTAIFKHAYNQQGAHDTVFFLANWVGMGLTVLPFGLSQGGFRLPSEGLGLGILIVLLYSLGDLTLFAAINRGPASIVSPLSGLYPLPTIAYSALILKEQISTGQWIAVGVVLVALVLIVPAPDNPVLKLLGHAPEAGGET
jgi:drug/metabolite transporter (DMT)-like permease